jgi:uncharacterized protein YaaR (DUF327 family)
VIIYSVKHDAVLKASLKVNKSFDDVLQSEKLKASMDEIENLLSSDKKAGKGSKATKDCHLS